VRRDESLDGLLDVAVFAGLPPPPGRDPFQAPMPSTPTLQILSLTSRALLLRRSSSSDRWSPALLDQTSKSLSLRDENSGQADVRSPGRSPRIAVVVAVPFSHSSRTLGEEFVSTCRSLGVPPAGGRLLLLIRLGGLKPLCLGAHAVEDDRKPGNASLSDDRTPLRGSRVHCAAAVVCAHPPVAVTKNA
jgi:hypothetical protein